MYYAETLAEWSVGLKFEHLPHDVVEKARLCLQDWAGISLYGSTAPWAAALRDVVTEAGGKEESTIVADGRRVPCASAAMVNAVMALGYDLSDTYPLAELHPSCSIIGSALAVAQRERSGGKELLEAITAGYEVMNRVGMALNMRPHSFTALRGYEANSLFPPFGAAVAAGKLLHLNERQMTNAIGLAGGSMGGATIEYLLDGNWTYRWNSGRAAQNGILNALMAQRGFVGPHAVFEGHWDDRGRYGVVNAFAGNLSLMDRLTSGLGQEWTIKQMGFKYFGCCHYIHGYNDAMLRLLREQDVTPEQIEQVTAYLPGMTLFLAVPKRVKLRPANLTVAQWSLPFCLATVALDGHLLDPRNQLSESKLNDSRVLSLADRITCVKDEALDQVFQREGILRSPLKVQLKDGRQYEAASDCKGFPYNPLTAEEFNRKFRAMASAVLDDEEISRLARTIERAEHLTDVSELADMLAG